MQEQQNKPGRKKRSYEVKAFNVRLDKALFDRMDDDNINKTELIHQLLRDYYKKLDNKEAKKPQIEYKKLCKNLGIT